MRGAVGWPEPNAGLGASPAPFHDLVVSAAVNRAVGRYRAGASAARDILDRVAGVQSNVDGRPAGASAGSLDRRADRLLRRLDELFEIGRASGTNRPGLGAGEQRAFELVEGWMRDANLEVITDPAGNLVGRL